MDEWLHPYKQLMWLLILVQISSNLLIKGAHVLWNEYWEIAAVDIEFEPINLRMNSLYI